MGGPGCGGGKSHSSKSNSYTPKKKSYKASPSTRGGSRNFGAGNFGQPKVRMSFSGRGR